MSDSAQPEVVSRDGHATARGAASARPLRVIRCVVQDWQVGNSRRVARIERPPTSMRMTDTLHLTLRRRRRVRHLATELSLLYSCRAGALAGPIGDATGPGVAGSRPPILALDKAAPRRRRDQRDRAWPASHRRVRGETIG